MAKQSINVGATANDKKGDSLRAAFQKVNANFTELYTALGLNDNSLNLGAFEFNGSVMTTTDSSAIVIDQATTITSDLTVGGDIVPSAANGGNLGSLAKPFNSLYVSNNTVFLGGVPLSLEPGTNELRVNNVPVSQSITYADIPNAPVDVSDLTDTTNLLGGGGGNANTGDISFDGTTIYAPDSDTIRIEVGDGDEVLRAYLKLDPDNGLAEMRARSNYQSASFNNGGWSSAVWTSDGGSGGRLAFNGANQLQTFLDNSLSGAVNITISVNEGEFIEYFGWSGGSGSITFFNYAPPPASPTTITNIDFRYYRESRIEINSDDDELTIYGDGLDINIESTTQIRLESSETTVVGSEYAQLESGNVYIWAESGDGDAGAAYIQVGSRTFEFNNVGDSPKLKLPAGADIVNSDGESVLGGGGGGANLQDILVDSPANMFDEGSGNFLNFNVSDDNGEWMRLGTLGNDKVQIITNYTNEGGNVWEFGTNGVLTFPSGMTIGDANGVQAIYGSDNNSVGILSQGSEGSSGLQWVDDLEETTAVAAVVVNSPLGEGTGKVQIVTGAFDSQNPTTPEHVWTFNNTGGLVFPDNTVQTTAYTGENLFAFSVAADDSTQKLISNNELIKFIGAGTVTTSSDAEGNITITGTGGSASLTDDKEVKVTVGNTDYFAIVNRANNGESGVESSAVAYDSEGNLIALHISEVEIGRDDNDDAIIRDRLIISKFDSSANLIWQKQIQEEMDISQAHDVCIDDDDNIIVVFSQDNIAGADDTVSAIKYTSAGSELWKKDYHPAVVVTIVRDPDLDSDTITSGTFNGTTVDVVTLSGRWDQLGLNSGWSLQESTDNGSTWTTIEPVLGFGAYNSNDTTTPLYLEANSGVTLTLGGGYYYRVTRQGVNSDLELAGAVTNSTHTFIAARYNENDGPGTGFDQSCIIKIDNSNGSLVWAKTFYIDEEGFDAEPYGMEIDSSGNLVVVGGWFTPGPTWAFVSKFNGITGAEIWTRILTNETDESTGGDVTADSQGNVFVSINARVQIVTEGNDTRNKTAVYITKLNSSGVIQWTRRVGPGPCASIGTGIDCDSVGNVYLSAITTVQKNPNRDNQNNNTDDITDTRDVLAIAKYSTSGTVLWQRYVEANGYNFYQSRSAEDGVSNFDWNENSGRNLSVSATGKLAVQATVKKRDLDDDVWSTRYWESITFQIDQDGREMTIGSGDEKFIVKESRIPGKFVTLVDPEDSTTGGFAVDVRVSTLTSNIEVTTPTITYADAELAQQIIKSASYEYVFGNDGTLTIPNDGDIKLTQTQIGWFSIYGQIDDDNFSVENRSNCVDPATGDVYVTGREDSDFRAFVARYNRAGELLWSIRLYDNDDELQTRGNAIKINPVTGNVTVLAEYDGGQNSMILEIDPDTAQIVNQIGFKDSVSGDDIAANTEAYDFDFQADGSIVAVGRKSDERRIYTLTPQTGSTTDVLIINRSDIGTDTYTDSWRISGTGLTGYIDLDFNYYSGLTGTVRQGTGAVFSIVIGGSGPYTYESVTATTAGTNYRVGHKIKILGTALEGLTTTNDAVIEVTGVNGSGGITSATITGTYGNAQAAPYTYTGKTGANFETGSGLTFNFWGPQQGTDYGDWDDHSVTEGGTNYADGDVVVIPGTQLGGTSPANDLIAIVNATTGTVDGFSDFTGTSQNTNYRIRVYGSNVDFGGTGTWTLSYNTGSEAFVWTNRLEGWNKVVGSLNPTRGDRYSSVATGSDGSIYAAGEIYTDDSSSDYQAVVSKFNSSGVHQWSRALNTNFDDNGARARSVAVRGTTVVVSHFDSFEYETVITKLDTSGNILWQRRTGSNDDSSVAIDTNGDIYAVIEAVFENKYNNLIKVIRFASNGEPIWRKFFSTLGFDLTNDNREYLLPYRSISLDAEHFYVSGYTEAFNSNAQRAFLVKLPKSGDCDGYYGSWTVQTDAYNVHKVNVSEANTFTPNIRNGNFESWAPDILSNWWNPSENDSYHTLQPVVDRDGGAIEFADGTRQTSSAQQIPQLKISNVGQHRLCLDDMGKHIYVTNSENIITVPAQYDHPLPIGFTVVIVNNSGNNSSIIIAGGPGQYGGGVNIIVPGVDTGSYWELADPGMATLIKVDEDTWFMTGNVTVTGP